MPKNKDNWRQIQGSQRDAIQSMSKAMRSIFDAANELITNVDDSYEVLNKPNINYQGDTIISYRRGGKKIQTVFSISDRATGMSHSKIIDILTSHGDKRKNIDASRAFFGRGLIDISFLGTVDIYSIKDGYFNHAQIQHQTLNWRFIEEKVTSKNKHQKIIGAKKHGTKIVLTIPIGAPGSSNPLANHLEEKIPLHYTLRNILNKDQGPFKGTLKLTFINENEKTKKQLQYVAPKGDHVVKNHKITLTPKSGLKTEAILNIFKSKDPLSDEQQDEYSDFAILIEGKKAIHEKSFLDSKYSNDPLARRYFGSLKCPYIDILAHEWEDRREKKQNHTNDNPLPIIDNERIGNLERRHPFIKNHLFKEAKKILDNLIEKDRETSDTNLKDDELDKSLNDKLRILVDSTKDIERDQQNDNLKVLGSAEWRAIPSTLKIKLGESAKVSVYTNRDNVDKNDTLEAIINTKDEKFIKIKRKNSGFTKSLTNDEIVRANFEIEALEEKEDIEISFRFKNFVKTQIKVTAYMEKNRKFEKDLEFEFENYSVNKGGRRNIKLFAKYPEVANEENLEGKVQFDNHNAIKVKENCEFKIIPNTNYAIANIIVEGIKVGDSSRLSVELFPSIAKTNIEVSDRKPQKKGDDFKIEIVDEDLGLNERAQWDFANPNLLKITTRHKIVRKYLGAPKPINGKYPYSNSPIWKTFENDILAEKFAEKQMEIIAQNKPIEYASLTKHNKDQVSLTISMVQQYYNKLKRHMVLQLHNMQNISESDLKKSVDE